MKLIIREYLSLLKESKELDLLLPDLLMSMGVEIISSAQVGVRQFGVDVAAAGKIDKEEKALYLLTIKQGDIGRQDWDGSEQAVRQSLNEIKDFYIDSHIRPEHKHLKIKIVLCTGGELKQEVQPNWNGYITNNTVTGKIEYEFWGGDKLALLIDEYMFNEYVLPKECQNSLRKTLALLADPDYNLSDYYKLLEILLLKTEYKKTSAGYKEIKRSLRTVHLCLNIIYYWAEQADNLKPALLSAERTLLLTWEFFRRNDLPKKRKLIPLFIEIYWTVQNIYTAYFNKIQNHCFVKDGLHGYSRYYLLENLNVFEQLGIIATIGLIYTTEAFAGKNKIFEESAIVIKKSLVSLINNHSVLNSPIYDSHIIEISEAIFLLSMYKEKELIKKWISDIITHITFAYRSYGKHFPASSDSFDDITDLNVSEIGEKENLFSLSTLLPILAQWCVILELNDVYSYIVETVKEVFPKTTLQIWYPDKETDNFLYHSNAALKSGSMEAPLLLPETPEEMISMIERVQANTIKLSDISSIKYGFPVLPFFSSRHFRTPFFPIFWQLIILSKK